MAIEKNQRVAHQGARRIVITPGEPAGIGPDIVLAAAQQAWLAELLVIADADLLQQRAKLLQLDLKITRLNSVNEAASIAVPGELRVLHRPLAALVTAGQLDVRNAPYVLDCLNIASEACLNGEAAALVTGPIQKSIVIESGLEFSGHTEYLAQRASAEQVVMMLASDRMRVALLTTHLPLSDVPAAITAQRLRAVLTVLRHDLTTKFHIDKPTIGVCGLNPHAGEGGHMGREDADIIAPCLAELRAEGMDLLGPLPADTAFTPAVLQQCDAMLSMYHDQGLPVIKYASFGNTVNVTLGLPFIRTSVDHGTALDIAATGSANPQSLQAALAMAIDMVGG